MSEPERNAAGALIPPPLIYIGALVLGLLLGLPFPAFFLSTWVGLPIGVLLAVLGTLVASSAFRALSRSGTPPDPSEPTSKIVQDGPFRFSRNPIYLAFTLIYLGFAFAFGSLWALLLFVLVLAVMDRVQIPREEKYLEKKFGEEYFRYKTKVRRWL